MKSPAVYRVVAAASLLMVAAACGPNEAERAKQLALVSHDSVMTQKSATLQAEKDSVFAEARNLFAAISSIDSATALAGFKAKKKKTEPLTGYEDDVRGRTVKALKRLRTVEAKLKQTLARADSIGADNAQLHNELNTLHETVAAMQAQVASQQARIDTLMTQLAAAQVREDSLKGQTRQLGTTIDSMVTESHKVYVVAGTKDYLIKNGIIEEVGGTRFPLIVRIGKTLRPVNAHPDTTLFQPLDMVKNEVIALDSTKRYEVVSSQDLSAADTANKQGRRVFHGSIHIQNPQRFWKASPYLILREL